MRLIRSVLTWLETHWIVPAYSGWVLSGLVIFFFGAATNTMAGWLYVISGILLALLVIAASLPPRTLRSLTVKRQSIPPIMAGDMMTVRVHVYNHSPTSRDLIQIRDALPKLLDKSTTTAIEILRAHGSFPWMYQCQVSRRGVYRWHTIQLRTAAPLGLFWCRRDYPAPAKAIVYPTILQLDQCPILDVLGQETHAQSLSHEQAHQANEGLTRALRPYRWGDPTRLIHWRTSARYGELRVRELEVLTSSPSIVIAIDTAIDWEPDCFEQAAITAVSLYDYARRQQIQTSIWTAEHATVHTQNAVYEILAAMRPQQGSLVATPISTSVVWLTQSSLRLAQLSTESRWLLWSPQIIDNQRGKIHRETTQDHQTSSISLRQLSNLSQGLIINPNQELRSQLLAAPNQGA